jgi:hypothetical protein
MIFTPGFRLPTALAAICRTAATDRQNLIVSGQVDWLVYELYGLN